MADNKKMDLHHEYHFLLDSDSSLNHHFHVASRPSIPAPARKWNEYSDVLSQSGTMRKAMDAFEEVSFSLSCNFIEDEYTFNDRWRKIRSWLLSDTSERKFQESYDLQWYRKVSKIEVSELSRTMYTLGEFTITITVDPYDYAVSGDSWCSIDDVKLNHYYKSEPLWQITNSGTSPATCTITVNDKAFEITDIKAGETKYVDVERRLTYSIDSQNYYLRAGRYGQEEWLMLQNGANSISVTDGFKVLVKPRWRNV